MKCLVVFACLVAAASAQWSPLNMMNNNMGQQPPQIMNNQGMNMGGNMGGNMQQLLQNQMGSQILQQLLQGQMNQMGQQMRPNGQQMGPMVPGQQGMTNNIMGSLLGNMLGSVLVNGLRGQMTPAEGVDPSDGLSRMEELAKMAMATEMMELMRAYNVFKDNEGEFTKAMYHLCLMVNATYAAARKYDFEIYNKTTEESANEVQEKLAMMSEEEKLEYGVDLLMRDKMTFEELFFRAASWGCWAGQAYLDSAMKLEKMEKGQSCEHDKK